MTLFEAVDHECIQGVLKLSNSRTVYVQLTRSLSLPVSHMLGLNFVVLHQLNTFTEK